MTTRLSVNVNKIAVLRNSRGGAEPDPCRAARICIEAGCAGITVHPRPDQRHIRHGDVLALRRLCADRVEFNIEGNPFAAARAGYPGLLPLIEAVRPEQCTLVPDGDGQLTSDHGFRLDQDDLAELEPLVQRARAVGCRVSAFVDAECPRIAQARAIGIDRVELYTGPYAEAFVGGASTRASALERFAAAAAAAQSADLGVNAGHDLSLSNLEAFLRAVPGVLEVSIGHALIAEALEEGLARTVTRYLELIARVSSRAVFRLATPVQPS